MLSFFGRGSAFADEHNSAFFADGKDLVLIDCPASAFQKVKHFDFDRYENIYVLITHTHGDHAGGVGMFLQYVYFALHRKAVIVVPCRAVYDDMEILLNRIEGCEADWYRMITADKLEKEWFVKAVPTKHSESLKGKCFGYVLRIENRTAVYTGDTAELEPFEPYLESGSVLYTELSLYKTAVHLYYKDILPELKKYAENGMEVYIMHLDDEKEMQKLISGTGIELAPCYSLEKMLKE